MSGKAGMNHRSFRIRQRKPRRQVGPAGRLLVLHALAWRENRTSEPKVMRGAFSAQLSWTVPVTPRPAR
jgi:hypothetical protein